MLIEPRDSSLAHTHRITQEKRLRVFRWLDEFRLSTSDVLAELLGLGSADRFLASCRARDYLVADTCEFLGRTLVYGLGKHGREELREAGLIPRRAKGNRVAVTRDFLHDLGLQRLIVTRLDDYVSVEYDRNIEVAKGAKRPDAVLGLHDGSFIALEYERSAKDKLRIYHELLSHRQAIEDGKFASVVYVFEDESMHGRYSRYAARDSWPIVEVVPGNGRMFFTGEERDVAGDEAVGRFQFHVQSVT